MPWAAKASMRAQARSKEDEAQDLEAETRWKKFKRGFRQNEGGTDSSREPFAPEHHLPCYYDAFQMGLWNPAEPTKLLTQVTVKWKIEPRFVDEFALPGVTNGTVETTVTLAQALPNTKHALEITGTDAMPITAIRVYRPALAKKTER